MAVTGDIIRAWRHPRQVMRHQLGHGKREDRALVFLISACLLIFVAQWPRLARLAETDPSMPFDIRIGGALLGWLFLAPLALYAIAALSRIIARLAGGKGDWYAARLALFWSLLVAAPVWIVNGLVAGLPGVAAVKALTGALALASFIAVWMLSLYEAEKGGAA